MAEYKADIKKNMVERNENRAKNENESAIIAKVSDNAEIDIPDCMVERQLDYIVQDMEYRMSYMYQGLKFEDYLKYTGSNMEDFRKDRREDAKKDVKTRLTLEAIIKAENLDVTDAEADEEIKKIAEDAGKEFDAYKKEVSEQQLGYIKNDLLMKKIIAFLMENNTFEKKETKKKTVKEEK